MSRTLTVPMFPLPRTVLFPAVRLPFYVFEPRYQRMLADVLDGPGLIGIPQVLPGFESSLAGSPPFTRVLGVGRVNDYVTHEDGTSHIEMIGLHRVQLIEELPENVYRRARVEILDDPVAGDDTAAEIRRRITDAVKRLVPLAVEDDARVPLERLLEDEERGLPTVVNTLATVLIPDPRTRQALLETAGVERRGRLLASEIDDLRSRLERDRQSEDEA